MKVRLGYACICNTIYENYHFKSITYTNYQKDNSKYNDVVLHNFKILKKIILFNISNNIHFYRISSSIIPLKTLLNIEEKRYNSIFKNIKYLVKKSKMRVDIHLSQYVVLNSVNKEIVNKSLDEVKYYYNFINKLTKKPILITHVGSNGFGKKNSIYRFINTFSKLDSNIKKSIVIENDDKVFNAIDVLNLCEILGVPMVLDYHHHLCNKCDDDLEFLLPRILKTWKSTPKIHFSSPKNKTKKDIRSHHDYINYDEFISFINILKNYANSIDIMIEAKSKDDALFKLIRELKMNNVRFIDDTSFIV